MIYLEDFSELDHAVVAAERGWAYLPACDEAEWALDEEFAQVRRAAGRERERANATVSLIPTTLRRANDFVAALHRHCGRTARNGGRFAIQAVREDSKETVGVVIVGNPLSATFMDGVTAEVTRLCVSPAAPRNTCSQLYGAAARCWKAMGGTRLITYTLVEESGASLRGAGWREVAACAPSGQRWIRKGGGSRRAWQPIYEQPKRRWEKDLR